MRLWMIFLSGCRPVIRCKTGICKMQRQLNSGCLISMRYFLFIIAVVAQFRSAAQQQSGFSLSLQLQPEITRHWEDYAHVWSETGATVTFNAGIQAGVQYRFAGRFFAEAGLGYISRRMNNTLYFFNQNVIPPPRQSPTQELVTYNNISYRTLELPFTAGVIFLKVKKAELYAIGGYSANYLLSARYGKGSNSKYAGVYSKRYWQGESLLAGIGTDIRIKQRLFFSTRVSYSLRNSVKGDPYLFSQSYDGLRMTHHFVQGALGIRWSLY